MASRNAAGAMVLTLSLTAGCGTQANLSHGSIP